MKRETGEETKNYQNDNNIKLYILQNVDFVTEHPLQYLYKNDII